MNNNRNLVIIVSLISRIWKMLCIQKQKLMQIKMYIGITPVRGCTWEPLPLPDFWNLIQELYQDFFFIKM